MMVSQRDFTQSAEMLPKPFCTIPSANNASHSAQYATRAQLCTSGVGVGAGMALAAKARNDDTRVYSVIREGELYEGSTWEVLLFAHHHELDNLTIIIDVNNLIILGGTDDCLKLNPIKDKIAGLGIDTIEVNGHDFDDLTASFKADLEKLLENPDEFLKNNKNAEWLTREEALSILDKAVSFINDDCYFFGWELRR